ncbi:MAG: UvrB/UvrC motif-containing protein [Planctomycetota bacterium]|jgi:protein arginine kinase activator
MNEATIHLTEIKQGKRTEVHVCAHCAHEQGITVKTHMPLNELLNNLLASQPENDEIFGNIEDKTCPHCGFNLEHFRKEPRLGCPQDYEVFERELLPLIEKAHGGGVSHNGKTPTRVPTETKKHIELSTLRKNLEEAVQKEDYEKAADLRDKINELE